MKRFAVLVTLLLGVMLDGVTAQNDKANTPPEVGFVDKTITVGGTEHRYVVYVPKDYRRDRSWPLLVFLHGSGECGTDGQKQVEVGLGPAIRKDPDRWPFVVVFPQKPGRASQWIDHDAMVMAMLAATEKEYGISVNRRYLTGLSQGGAGAWALGAKHADVFNAIAPVCGYGQPADVAAQLKATPIWAFHGEDDKTVPLQQSLALVAAVKAMGNDPVLTIYEATAHNSWDKAYGASNLAEWLRLVQQSTDLARVLAAPEQVREYSLTLNWTKRTETGEAHERVTVATDEAGRWQRTVESRGRAPETLELLPRDAAKGAAKGVAECVRILVRAGIVEVGSSVPEAGDYVAFYERSTRATFGAGKQPVPRVWRQTPEFAAAVAEVRRATDLLLALR